MIISGMLVTSFGKKLLERSCCRDSKSCIIATTRRALSSDIFLGDDALNMADKVARDGTPDAIRMVALN